MDAIPRGFARRRGFRELSNEFHVHVAAADAADWMAIDAAAAAIEVPADMPYGDGEQRYRTGEQYLAEITSQPAF